MVVIQRDPEEPADVRQLRRVQAPGLPREAHGAIVNLLDQRLLKPTPEFFSYSVSRAGLYWLTTTAVFTVRPPSSATAIPV